MGANNLPEIPAVWDRTEADAAHEKYQKKAKGICAGQRVLRDRITSENEARCDPCQGANRCTNQQRSSTWHRPGLSTTAMVPSSVRPKTRCDVKIQHVAKNIRENDTASLLRADKRYVKTNASRSVRTVKHVIKAMDNELRSTARRRAQKGMRPLAQMRRVARCTRMTVASTS
jgi:hypothetical protein